MGKVGRLPGVLVALALVGVVLLLAMATDLGAEFRGTLAFVGVVLAVGQMLTSKMGGAGDEGAMTEKLHAEKEVLVREKSALAAELEEVEHYFDTLMESVPSNVYFKDKSSRFLKVNQSMADWIGVGHPADLIGKTDADLFGSEHAEAAREDEEKIMRTGRSLTGYVEKETFDTGDETWVLTNKMPFRDREGFVVGTCGISSDVTELVSTQSTLERERNTLRLLIDGFPDNIYIRDPEGKYLVVNQALATFAGCEKPEDMVGRSPLEFFPRDRAEAFLVEDREVIKTGNRVINRESSLRAANGEMRQTMISKIPVHDPEGKVVGVVGWNRDVTEQRRAAEELRRSEQRVQEIVDHCPAVIYLKDMEGRYLMHNRRYEELFGIERHGMLGKTDFDVFDEETGACVSGK